VHEKELCLKFVIYKDYTEMHDQQIIKFHNLYIAPLRSGFSYV